MRQLKIGQSITTREPQLNAYLQEISRYELITPEEEVELSQRIQQGDKEALNRLVCANLRFVVSVAKNYQGQGMKLCDLISEGNIGLIKAAQRFDETRGFKFISYAVWWIRQAILQAVQEQSRVVRIPLNKTNAISRINKAINDFVQKNLRQPSEEEISQILNMEIEQVENTLAIGTRQTSIDAPFKEGEDNSLLDVMRNDDSPMADENLNHESLMAELERTLSNLSPRDSAILRLYYGLGCKELSLDEIGERFDLSRERVRQLKEKALRHVKSHLSINLRPYLT